jgi:hypothetical protein
LDNLPTARLLNQLSECLGDLPLWWLLGLGWLLVPFVVLVDHLLQDLGGLRHPHVGFHVHHDVDDFAGQHLALHDDQVVHVDSRHLKLRFFVVGFLVKIYRLDIQQLPVLVGQCVLLFKKVEVPIARADLYQVRKELLQIRH